MIKLPTTEETTRSYQFKETQISFELIELDELHKAASEIARNNKEDFYDVFNKLLNVAKQITLPKAAIYLIILRKNADFEVLKKTSSNLDYSSNTLDCPPSLQLETSN